ncbi:MAG: vWA domain-containing protein [Spirochaetia bacterium]
MEHPSFLWFLGLVPILLLWGVIALRRQRRDLSPFLSSPGEGKRLALRGGIALVCILVFTSGIILSLGGFTQRKRNELVRADRVSIVLCVDISRSMLASDVGKSRLSVVQEGMLSIIRNYPGGSFGIVAFKGDAVTMVPLTDDFRALELFIRSLSPALISSPGTDVGGGIEEAVRAFPPGIAGHRVIILFSDGESTRGRIDTGIAAKEGIPIVAVPVGTESGSAIELNEDTYVRGPEGEKVITRVRAGQLEDIAEATGGVYVPPGEFTGGIPLDRLLDPWMETTLQRGYRMIRVPRYRIFLFPAFLGLVAYLFFRRLA